MITCLGKSCSFGLPRVPFVYYCQFMYLVYVFMRFTHEVSETSVAFLDVRITKNNHGAFRVNLPMPIYTCTTHHTIRNIRSGAYHTVRPLDIGEYAAVLTILWSKQHAQAESTQPRLPKTVDRESNTTSSRHQQTGFTTKTRHNPSRTEWCNTLYPYLQPGEPPCHQNPIT